MTEQRTGRSALSAKSLTWTARVVLLALVASGCQGGGQEQQSPQQTGVPEQQARESPAEQKRRSVENLKQIAQAMKKYAQTTTLFPPAVYLEPSMRPRFSYVVWPAEHLAKYGTKLKGKTVPLFSWRVALLPYLEEKDLYKQFKFDEPWDSEHNKKLLARMPKVYASVTGKQETGLTYYQVFTSQDTPFNGMEPPRVPAAFQDGMAFTFLVVEAADAVPWTKPQDIPYDARKALPKLGGLFADGFHAVMGDYTIHFVPRGASEKSIRATITPRGGEVPDPPGKLVK